MSRSSRKRQMISMRGSGSAFSGMVFGLVGMFERGCWRVGWRWCILGRVRLCEVQLGATPAQGILLGISSQFQYTDELGNIYIYF